jgi:putative oxidoreductase
MKKNMILVLRSLFGLMFLVFGLNGFLHFLPMPPISGPAGAFMGALIATGYMMPLIKGVEVICGAMLLANCWSALALVLLAPNVVNIFLFHTLLAPSGIVMGIVVLILEVFLMWSYRDRYLPMFKMK